MMGPGSLTLKDLRCLGTVRMLRRTVWTAWAISVKIFNVLVNQPLKQAQRPPGMVGHVTL